MREISVRNERYNSGAVCGGEAVAEGMLGLLQPACSVESVEYRVRGKEDVPHCSVEKKRSAICHLPSASMRRAPDGVEENMNRVTTRSIIWALKASFKVQYLYNTELK